MKNNNAIAYLLIGVGALALLSRVSGDTGWFWVGLVAAAFIAAYASRKSYGLLIPGCILTGVAVGILLEGAWGWNGAFLISLGVGFAAIDRVEPRKSRWPVLVGGILAVLGVLIGLAESGVLGSVWLALLLIGGGVYMIRQRGKKTGDEKSGDKKFGDKGWVKVDAKPAANTVVNKTPDTVTAAEAGVAPASADDTQTEPQPAVNRDVVTDMTVSIEPGSSEAAPAEAAPQGAGATGEPAPEEAAPVDEALYTQLTDWRTETAKREDRAAYLILTNASLEQIATDKPNTLDELRNIKGIGPVKLERYGQAILDLLNS